MSKGKRKSNPEALAVVRQRLAARCAQFTQADRPILMQISRQDLIHILEVDLGLGPLRASQKNSVAVMVDWLLSQQGGGEEGSDPQQQTPVSGSDTEQAAAGMMSLLDPVSVGGSCHTPPTDPDDDQLDMRQHAPGAADGNALGAAVAAAAAAAGAQPPGFPVQPWLAELQQQLEAARDVRGLRADSTDTDDDADTEADSGWVGQSQSAMTGAACKQEPAQQGAVSAAPADASTAAGEASNALSVSQIEELLVQQLLLDIESKPKHRSARRVRSSLASFGPEPHPQQQQQQPQLQTLLQQQQQVEALTLQQLQLQQKQQQQQQLDFNRFLQEELLIQQLQTDGQQPNPAQQPAATAQQQPQLLPGPSTAGDSAAAIATWPLPQPIAAGAAAAAGGSGRLPGLGPLHHMQMYGLSDGCLMPSSLPSSGCWRPAPVVGGSSSASRLSFDGGGGGLSSAPNSFTRKRDKMVMGHKLPSVADEVLLTGGLESFLVEASGPSADLPTKRMSVTLPGSNEVASLPTSFSGRAGGSATLVPRTLPGDDLTQLSSYEDLPSDLPCVWQQQPSLLLQEQQQHIQQQLEVMQQQQQSQQPGTVSGLANRLKTFLRGDSSKAKTKARRYHSVGAGGSFSASAARAAASGTNRIPSAGAALALQEGAATASGSSQFACNPAPGFQQGTPSAAGAAAAGYQPTNWLGVPPAAVSPAVGLPPPAARDSRQWHSMAAGPTARQLSDHNMTAATSGLSWHAERSTMINSSAMSQQHFQQQQQWQYAGAQTAAARYQPGVPSGVSGSSSVFAQQLEQLRAQYADQMGDEGGIYGGGMPAGAGHNAAAAAGGGGNSRPGFVGKLKRALKLGSQTHLPALAGAGGSGAWGAMDADRAADDDAAAGDDANDDLLITGRCDGALNLAGSYGGEAWVENLLHPQS